MVWERNAEDSSASLRLEASRAIIEHVTQFPIYWFAIVT
jgi:hypothetical protein